MYMRLAGAASALFLLSGIASGCSSDSDSPGGAAGSSGAAGSAGAAGTGGGAPDCDVHASEAPRFERATSAWGLTGVLGGRVAAVDLDGDDYPDLIVHGGAPNARAPNSAPATRILMNRPKAGGGREFVDRSLPSGYGAPLDGDAENQRSAQFAIAADIDNDGDLDLFSGTFTDKTKVALIPTPGDLDRSQILLNDGAGNFSVAPALTPHGSAAHATSGASFVDVNQDGLIDLFVVGWYDRYGQSNAGTQARLYLGAGDGSFTDVTGGSGLRTELASYADGRNHRPAYGATACDVDDDGDVDLLVSAYGRQFNQLYLNDGAGGFTEVGRASGFSGDEDLSYQDNQFFRCWCTVQSDPMCPASSPNIVCPDPADSYWSSSDAEAWRNNGNTFTTACGDVDGDGLADLYNAEIRHWWAGEGSDASRLLVADLTSGELRYHRPGLTESGLALPHPDPSWNEGGINAAIVDLDLDGRSDVVLTTSDYPDQALRVFHQQADGSFQEVAGAWGLMHSCSVGLAIADFDRDGDLDIVVGSSRARDCAQQWDAPEVHLYQSDASTRAKSVSVRLEGAQGTNRAAIGAKVRLSAGGVVQVKEVGGGYGHFGMQHELPLTFGVGACTEATAEVLWPNGARSRGEVPVTAGALTRITQE